MNIELRWSDGLRFEGRYKESRTAIDGHGEHGVSPVAMLLESLAGCMGSDVVEILRKGREELRGLELRATAIRREKPPRRITAVGLEFLIDGPVSRDKAERAVQLSLQTYCSVWHTLRDDIELEWALVLREDG